MVCLAQTRNSREEKIWTGLRGSNIPALMLHFGAQVADTRAITVNPGLF